MSVDRRLTEILALLEPAELRRQVSLPWEEIREEFVPRFLSTDSYDEFIREAGRFVALARQKWLKVDVNWPRSRAESEARRLVEGSVGVERAMQAVRHGDHGGMRRVLNDLTKALQRKALDQYMNHRVLPLVNALNADQSIALAEAYLSQFQRLGLKMEHPAVIAAKWRTVLQAHVQLALT